VEIEATALVPASPDDVFDFLSDLENHWRLTGRRVEVLGLNGDRDGGSVRIRGPLGLHRTARTKVTASRSPRLILGVAELPGGTRARVSWTLAPHARETRVALVAEVEKAAPLDRLMLAVGGRRWMAQVFERALERLAERFR
jgi:carbon monoxide dehydrogenase subunit G